MLLLKKDTKLRIEWITPYVQDIVSGMSYPVNKTGDVQIIYTTKRGIGYWRETLNFQDTKNREICAITNFIKSKIRFHKYIYTDWYRHLNYYD